MSSRLFACLAAMPLVALLLSGPAVGQQKVKATQGLSGADYQTWVNSLDKEGLRLQFVSVYGPAASPQFAGVAVGDGREWSARHNLTAKEYRAEFDKRAKEGYRLTALAGYAHGTETQFAAAWSKDPGNLPWVAHHDMTAEKYQAKLDELKKEGFRPVHVTGYPVGASLRLAAIFVNDKVTDWKAYHDLTAAEYQKQFNDLPKGYRPVSIAAYSTGKGVRFALVVAADGGPVWVARHNLTADDYQKEFDKWTAQGYRPTHVVGYSGEGGIRYAALFARPAAVVAKGPLPMTGDAVAELAAFDDAMQKFMRERSIPGGTLAVMKNGKLLLSRGYGHSDDARTHLCGPATPMRIASVSKPITLALLLQLIREGKLTLETKAFAFLGTKAPPGQTMDKRLLDITIGDLIGHKGGWDRDAAGDPMFRSLKIAAALGKAGPATAEDIITYMAGQPLQFNPGSKSVYSNFGYCVLGRVIEKATGKSYIDALQQKVTGPLGLKSIQLGRTLPKDRDPKEPTYFDPHIGRNVMQPKSKNNVPAADGTFCLEAMDAHGGLIASAPDLVAFLQAYWMDGRPRKAGETAGYRFFGSLPGTWSLVIQRQDGTNIAALFNQREDPSGLKYDDIAGLLNKAAASVK